MITPLDNSPIFKLNFLLLGGLLSLLPILKLNLFQCITFLKKCITLWISIGFLLYCNCFLKHPVTIYEWMSYPFEDSN